MKRFALAAALAVFAAPGFAQTAPSADCARVATAVEKAICADPALGQLDRAIREAYAKAQGRVDRDARTALQKDQKEFVAERAMVFANGVTPLAAYLKNRLQFLEKLENPAWSRQADAFVGTWRSSLGEVRIAKDEAGKLVVAISTLSPAESKWVCDIEGSATGPRNGQLEFTEDEVKITLSRRGSALIVGDQVPQGDGGRSFCGANGYIDGAYFKVK
jgi:uncharacterized protein